MTTTKPQKIEGGMKKQLKHDLSRFVDKYDVDSEESQEMFVKHLVELFSTEIEKAKAEAYRAGLDFQKQSVEMIEKAVRASERQRCVEDCIEALPKKDEWKKRKYDAWMCEDVGYGFELALKIIKRNMRKLAKHNLQNK